MKIIISHDVDHLTALEHVRDLILPKHILRSILELGLGHATVAEMGNRLGDILKNRLHNLDSLLSFDREEEIPSTFFIGVAQGKGLTYSLDDAAVWISRIFSSGFDIGVHGISYEGLRDIRQEWTTFSEKSGLSSFGIRMHYLRSNQMTLESLSKIGYVYDSSVDSISPPYRIGSMWEFPLHIMDSRVFCVGQRWQNQTLDSAIDRTKRFLDDLYLQGVSYCTVCFHDMHFSDSFLDWKEWYIWLVRYLKDNKLSIVSFRQAVAELRASDE